MSRVLFGLMVLGIAVAVLRTVVLALIVVLLFFLLLAFLTRPRETLSYVLSLGLCGLIAAHPVACIVTLGVIALAVVAVDALRKLRHQPHLTNGTEPRIGSYL